MSKTTLLGSTSHKTLNGVRLNIVLRNGKYIARGRYEGQAIGPTLGADVTEAAAELRRIMGEIEAGTYVRPSDPLTKERRRRRTFAHLTLQELFDLHLEDIRRTKGKATACSYQGRLNHVLAFLGQTDVKRRYAFAQAVDCEFVIALRNFLQQRQVSRNGHPNSPRHPMSPKQIRNVLEALRGVFAHAMKPAVRRLPSDFVQPVTEEVLGPKMRKDPLRAIPLPADTRLRLIEVSDAYQLLTLGLLYVLPLRPEQCSGLLINEIDWEGKTFSFRTRFEGNDFTKSKTSFTVPFPHQLEPLLRCAISSRRDGPVFQKRSVWMGGTRPKLAVVNPGDMAAAAADAIAQATKCNGLTPGDAKDLCREAIRDAGGTSPDEMSKEFKKLVTRAGLDAAVRCYDLRHSVDSEMARVRAVPGAHLRYLMGHESLFGGSQDEYVGLNLEDVRDSLEMYWSSIAEVIQTILRRGSQLGLWQEKNAA